MRLSLGTFAAAALAVCGDAVAEESATRLKSSMELGIEGRVFLQQPAYAEQGEGGFSIFIEPELDYAIPNGSLRFVPFARWDSQDEERSHADIREATLRQRRGDFDFLFGIGRVFWGTTESVHLVDIVNQTDLVENPDGEDKLGQPLASLTWTTPLGSFAGLVLPVFRERRLPGEEARLRAPIPYDTDDALYESDREHRHVDAAARWSLSRGALDLGLSHFSGTAREPRFVLGLDGESPVLAPVYDLIEQTGVDLSAVQGGWLWKLEAIHNDNRVRDYSAAAGGFEYTFASVRGSAWDVGALAEYLWDERGEAEFSSAYQNDLFLAARLAGNDVQGTEILVGTVIDLDRGGRFYNLEASRRLGVSGKLTVELRLFSGSRSPDPLIAYRQDDYLQVEYVRYF